jgi:TIR domain
MAQIFISYRRDDSIAEAGRLCSDLMWQCGKSKIFLDYESIKIAEHFPTAIGEAIAASQVVLVVIGNQWLVNAAGQRRLEEPNDWVRQEIAAALTAKKKVIAVLVQGAKLPRRDDLPETVRDLVEINCANLRYEDWRSDVRKLMQALQPEIHCKPPFQISTVSAILTSVALIVATHVLTLSRFPTIGFNLSLALSALVSVLFGLLHLRHGAPKIQSLLPIALAIATLAVTAMHVAVAILYGLPWAPESAADIHAAAQFFAAILAGYLLGAALDQIRATRLLSR